MQTQPVEPPGTATQEAEKMPKFQVTVFMRGDNGIGDSLHVTGSGDTATTAFDKCLSLIGEALSESD